MNALSPNPGETIAVWFSCGAASAVAARETLRRYGNLCNVRIVNTYIAEEDEDNRRFGADVAAWLGHFIEFYGNPKWPTASAVDVWEHKKAMSFPTGAPCTGELKKGARQAYEKLHCIGCVKATSPTYWNLVRQMHPEVFRQRAEQSRRLGVKLVRYKGKRIYLDELPPDAVGRPLKTMKTDCGVFCEEKP